MNPMRLALLIYLVLVGAGTVLLYLPFSTKVPVRLVDAFFTAVSAVTTTGLSVVNVGTAYNSIGHWTIVVLMQVGGLGIMIFSTLIILISGMRPGFSQQSALLSDFSQKEKNIDIYRVLKAVIPFTIVLELFGILSLFTQFSSFSLYDRILYSVFHGVSSFCNVGFSLFSNSFMDYQLNPVVNISVGILVLAGGFGFLAIAELRYFFNFKMRQIQRISLHTRIVFICTFSIVIFGTLFILFTEWNCALAGYSFIDKLFSASFMAVTSRTSGFSTLNLPGLGAGSLFFMILLMFIGASPGSCGGGIKTTTAAVIALLGFNRLLGRERTQFLGRTIPDETVQKAVRLFVVAIIMISLATLILLLTEFRGEAYVSGDSSFLKVFFEVVSAYSTVGLSLGFTTELSDFGRLLICIVMFIGRLGPLFLISAVAPSFRNQGIRYAEENIMVG
jgi:trk system potassium uptake protein TrkH